MIQIQIGKWKASILPENEITYRIKLSTLSAQRVLQAAQSIERN